MKKSVCGLKVFVIATLIIVLVGALLIGIFGFNGTVDNPNKVADGYELQVSVNQNVSDADKIITEASEEFFKTNKLGTKGISQEVAEGKSVIYKFNKDVSGYADQLKTFVLSKLEAKNLSLEVTVDVREVNGQGYSNLSSLVIALVIATVAIFVYSLIIEKLAGALATIFSAFVSVLAFIALLGITRIPALPFIGVGIAVALVVSSALSVSTSNRFREETKNTANSSLSASELTFEVSNKEKNKYIIFAIIVALISIALIAFALPHLMIAGAQILIAGLCGVGASYFGTPLIWSAVKGLKKGK